MSKSLYEHVRGRYEKQAGLEKVTADVQQGPHPVGWRWVLWTGLPGRQIYPMPGPGPDEIEAMTKAKHPRTVQFLYAQPAPGWQPAETAPADTEILVMAGGYIGKAIFLTSEGEWYLVSYYGEWEPMDEQQVSLWMPLPEEPE